MIRLRTLGAVELADAADASVRAVLAQPKRLALLVHLAAARPAGFRRRESLLACFWPELDEPRARDALSQALRFLRRALGDGVIVTRGADEVGVDPARLWCDAAALAACADRPAEVLELYRGEFLEGLFADAAGGFEEWLDRERAWLRATAARAARRLAEERERDGNYTTAVNSARRAVELADLDERVVRELLELLDRLGDRAGAVHAYEAFARRLAAEYEATPAEETRALIERIRASVEAPARATPKAREAPRRPEVAVAARTGAFDRPLDPSGTSLNGWRVERPIGRGGSADIFLARDVKHDRPVALKVLRQHLAQTMGGPERFLREVRITSALAHPHILPLLDSGECDGALYLVTPFVDGETLRERLLRERLLPVDEALRIAREVAAAIDYAHRQGVVHRDIKPENILLQDGQALVADFGIALAASVASRERLTATGTSITDAALLGTPAYMSPEQLAGAARVDGRSDQYALAVVLYEMLAGEPPFWAPEVREIVARVMREVAVPVRERRDAVPRWVEAAIQRALSRLPADRFPSMAAFSRAIESPSGAFAVLDVRERPSRRARARDWVAGALVTAAAGAVVALASGPDAPPAADEPLRRTTILLPDSAPVALAGTSPLGASPRAIALAPDGGTLAYVARVRDGTMLHVRRLDEEVVRAVPGSEGAFAPFFSPDGASIGYFAGARLYRVAADGGPPSSIADLIEPTGGVWLSDGTIAVVEGGGTLTFVHEQTGARTRRPVCCLAGAIQLGDRAVGSRWIPAAVGRTLAGLHVGDTVHARALAPDTAAGSALTGPPASLLGSHLVFVSVGGDALLAMAFDTARLVARGRVVPLRDRVRVDAVAQLAAADDGTIVYVAGEGTRRAHLAWRRVGGGLDTLPVRQGEYAWLALSPDARHVALAEWTTERTPRHLVFDLATGAETVLPPATRAPFWSPDTRSLLVADARADGRLVTLRLSPATGEVLDTVLHEAGAFAVDGLERTFLVRRRADDPDAWVARRDSSAWRYTRIRGMLGEMIFPRGSTLAALSPSGRWVALTVRVLGRSEVFVAPVDDPDARVRVTLDGGEEPLWRDDEREIVYRDGTRWLAVPVETAPAIRAGAPRVLFEGPYANVSGYSHARARDGRHLVVVSGGAPTARRLEMVTGLAATLRRTAPLAPGSP